MINLKDLYIDQLGSVNTLVFENLTNISYGRKR